jgi:hypothetical protein
VRLLVAARELSTCDWDGWRDRLGWQAATTWAVPLSLLNRVAVQRILASMGNPLDALATQIDWLAQLERISEGDPLTIRFVIEGLQRGDITPEHLTRMPPGLKAYVTAWVDTLAERSSDNEAVLAFLTRCAAAYAPLTAHDLQQLAPAAFTPNLRLRQVLKDGEVARFILTVPVQDAQGRQQDGYVFSHQRLREIFWEDVPGSAEQQAIQQEFFQYGAAWYADRSQPLPDYLRQFWVTHLAEAGAWDTLRRVLTEIVPLGERHTQPWAAARYAAEGSYAGYLSDLAILWQWAEAQHDIALGVRCALIQASIRSLSGNLTPELLMGLVTVGTPEGKWSTAAALEHIRQMPDSRRQVKCITALVEAGCDLPWQVALDVAHAIPDEWACAEALGALAPHLSKELQRDALDVARVLSDYRAECGARVLTALVPHLAQDLLRDAFKVACAIPGDFLGSRAEVLVVLAPRLPQDLLRDAFEVAQALPDDFWGRCTDALAALALHMPPELLRVALDVARAIQREKDRARALTLLTTHLPQELQSTVWPDALAAARAIPDKKDHIEALTALAPYLPQELQAAVWADALAAARAIQGEENRPRALAALAPHLPSELQATVWVDALAAARAIAKEWARAGMLSAFVPHLPDELLPAALAAARAIETVWIRAETLGALAPHLPQELQATVWKEALVAALAIPDYYEEMRGEVLVILAPHLPEDLVQDAVRAACTIHDYHPESRAAALGATVPHLPEELQASVWHETLTTARAISHTASRARALTALASHLPQELQSMVWDESLAAAHTIHDERDRTAVLAALAPYLPKGLLRDAFDVARAIPGEWHCNQILTALAPHLLQELLRDARTIPDPANRALALAALAPHVPQELQATVWNESLATARAIPDEQTRAAALATLVCYLPQELLSAPLTVVRAIPNERTRAEALVALAPYTPEELPRETLATARAIPNERARAEALAALAPHLPQELQVTV